MNLFSEFESRQCNVQFRKVWPDICGHIIKHDKEVIYFGEVWGFLIEAKNYISS